MATTKTTRRKPGPKPKSMKELAAEKTKEPEPTPAPAPTPAPTPEPSPEPETAPESPAAPSEGNISVSQPTTAGTQIIVTAKGLDPSVAALVTITDPVGESRQRLKTDPNGTVQVFLHGPKAGRHSVSIKAGASEASTEFDVG